MNTTQEDIMAKIIEAFDQKVPIDILVRKFPQHRAAIKEIEEMRRVLNRAAVNIPKPITKPFGARLSYVEGSVESPSFINSFLLFSMNYKIILPALIIGVLAVGGIVFLSGNSEPIVEDSEMAPVAETTDNSNRTPESNDSDATSSGIVKQTAPTQVTASVNLNDILTDFSADVSSEQAVYVDDGLSAEMFAQSELSSFDLDTYDY